MTPPLGQAVTTYVPPVTPALDEHAWQAWLQRGRDREAIFDRRSTVAFAVVPLVVALIWFGSRMT